MALLLLLLLLLLCLLLWLLLVLLVVVGCCWLLVLVVVGCWLLLVVVGCWFWWLLVVLGCSWLLLDVVGCWLLVVGCWLLVVVVVVVVVLKMETVRIPAPPADLTYPRIDGLTLQVSWQILSSVNTKIGCQLDFFERKFYPGDLLAAPCLVSSRPLKEKRLFIHSSWHVWARARSGHPARDGLGSAPNTSRCCRAPWTQGKCCYHWEKAHGEGERLLIVLRPMPSEKRNRV